MILTGDERLIVWADRGTLQLVETKTRSPGDYKRLAEKKNIFGTEVWPHVVLANRRIYCKDREGNLKCFAIQ